MPLNSDWYFFIKAIALLVKILAFRPETQNRQFHPLRNTTNIPVTFIFESQSPLPHPPPPSLACVQTSPIPQEKIGRRDEKRRWNEMRWDGKPLLPIFSWRRGDRLYTGYSFPNLGGVLLGSREYQGQKARIRHSLLVIGNYSNSWQINTWTEEFFTDARSSFGTPEA